MHPLLKLFQISKHSELKKVSLVLTTPCLVRNKKFADRVLLYCPNLQQTLFRLKIYEMKRVAEQSENNRTNTNP